MVVNVGTEPLEGLIQNQLIFLRKVAQKLEPDYLKPMKNFAVTACIHPDQHVLYKHG